MTKLAPVYGASAFVVLALTIASGQEFKELLESSPAYQPEQHVSGVIRIWGHGNRNRDYVGGLVKSWEEGFRKYQPKITFETELRGNASAIGGLYTGTADVAFLGREIWPIEADGYEQGLGYKPFQVSVATGSVEDRNHDFALAILVHRDNPLLKLTLAQLDAIFGADHKRGGKNIRTWSELGLTGEWTDKPINLYGYGIDRDFSQFFEQAVLAGSRKWNCSFREIADERFADGSIIDAGRRIVDALAKDRYGIGFSSLAYKNPAIRAIALARDDGGPYYSVTKETLIEQKYPLTRTPYMFVNRPPGQPVDPKVKEFLRYVLSREGQEAVIRDGGYLPLSSEALRKQREKLQ